MRETGLKPPLSGISNRIAVIDQAGEAHWNSTDRPVRHNSINKRYRPEQGWTHRRADDKKQSVAGRPDAQSSLRPNQRRA